MILQGVVETGIGDFGAWIASLQTHYERKTGMWLFPGMLNVHLNTAFEITTDVCLRDLYSLNDGDVVSIKVGE